jgi:hypothetical protein
MDEEQAGIVTIGSGISRRSALKRGALLGGALAWSTPLVQTIGLRAAHAAGSPVPLCGRMTGGGNNPKAGKIVRYGFELHCSTAVLPNNLEVAFLIGSKEVNVHLDTLTGVVCSDDPAISPVPPDADFDTMVGTGTGHLTGPGVPGCTGLDSAFIEFKLQDGGEGPSSKDFIQFKVTCPSSPNPLSRHLGLPLGWELPGARRHGPEAVRRHITPEPRD